MSKLVQGRGDPNSRVLLLGEKPGHDELATGIVFRGRTGTELEKIAFKSGIRLSEVWLDNLLQDAPTGEDYSVTPEDLERNKAHIDDLLFNHNFKTIVTMGAVATKYLLDDGTNDVRCDIGTVHAIPHELPWAKVFPTYHPAAGLHDGDAYPFIMQDFQLLSSYLKGWPGPDRTDYHALAGSEHYTPITDSDSDLKYLEHHVVAQAVKSGLSYVFIDTEGSVTKPWCLSFSFTDGEAYVIQTKHRRAVELFSWLMSCHGFTIVMHFAPHDMPVLRVMGFNAFDYNCRLLDTMIMAYVLQTEPQGLKNLAYRNCGMVMSNYIDIVEPYSTDKRLDYLIALSEVDWGKPEPIIEEKKNEIKVTNPQGLNRRINSILKDLQNDPDKVDIYKRWNDIHASVRQPAIAQFGELPIADLDDVPFEVAWRYAARDADATGRVFTALAAKLQALNLWDTFLMDSAVLPCIEEMVTTGFKTDPAHFKNLEVSWRGKQGRIRKSIADRIGRFINPESAPQVRQLLFDEMKLPVYKETEGGFASTADKAIDWLKTSDQIPPESRAMVFDIGEHRELDKGVSSFVQPILDYAARDSSGESRLHTNLKYTRVVSGRFSAAEPNLLAIPVRSALGKEIRGGFIAGDGHLLGSWDLNQIEMRFMAHESGDRALCDTYARGGDVHRDTAAEIFGKRVEDITDEERDPAKRVAFGVITGITEEGLHGQYMLNGITKYSKEDCRQQIKAWFGVHKEVEQYLIACRQEVRRFGYAKESIGGRIRYLQSIHSTNKRIAAEAERASHSHKISSGAQAILKKSMAALWPQIEDLRRRDGCYIRWILQVHDELIFEFDEGYEDVLDYIITEALCHTVKLRVPIKAKGKFARNWGKLK